MEKIVTKIGDVTIERRVSKPPLPKVSQEPSVGSNLQQQNVSPSKNIPSKSKVEEQAKLSPQPSPSTESLAVNKNLLIPAVKNIAGVSVQQGGNYDLKSGVVPKKSATGNQTEFPSYFPKPETAKSQETAQKSDTSQLMPKPEAKVLEMSETGVSLPKVPRIDNIQKQTMKVTQNQSKNVTSEPDLSKYVGISIERRKRVDVESQPKTSTEEDVFKPALNPSVSVKKVSVNPQENAELNPEDFSEEEFEDSFDEDDFEDENVPFDEDAEVSEEFKEPPSRRTTTDEDVEKVEPEAMVEEEEEELVSKKEVEEEVEEPIKEEQPEQTEVKEEKEDYDGEKETDINDFACTDLVELMQKGEIEGEIEDVKDEEMISEGEKKEDGKRKAEDADDEGEGEEEGGDDKEKKEKSKPARKKKKTEKGESDKDEADDEGEEEEGDDNDKNLDKSKITNANLRKNIREVMDETKLDEATLAAQRQEAERLKRLQEQQRIIREVQRQIALNRQNQKSQNKVLSLLQGNSQTSILKTSSTTPQAQNLQAKTQNSVLVKLSNGEQTSLNNKKMMELLKNSKNKTILGKPPIPKTLLKQGMVTPSVSIAPVVKKEPVVDDKKKKKGDIVTLSSDSEDDCIVLSDEDESEPEEDPTNSGMHTNDKYNLPDEKGRVIVNVGHPESESDLYLAPQIARIIKPHQIGGIRFLYDNVIESIERFGTSAGFGCILAHSMGLGKTLQIVSFSDIFLRYTTAKTILCIMPINTIQNWLAEFNMWLPKESTAEDVRCREFDLFIVNESLKNINARAKVILDWSKSGGVLLMGYELFRLLSLKKQYKSKKKRKKSIEEDDAKNKQLIEEVYAALVRPGPDLVICDEGHRIKNSHATTSQALKQIRTKRRIVLTGYPLQNNLLEYWCMVDFVRPNYLGTKTEFSNMFERPIQNGQCIDSTPQDKRLMRYRAHVLHSLLEGFVQRRSHAVLQSALPEKEEYVLLLRFTSFQRKLYDTFMNEVVRTVAVPNPLKAFAVCCKIWNHPDVLYNFLKKKGEEIDLDLEEALPPSLQPPQFPYAHPSMGPDMMTQQTPMQTTPWPRRGPGSRGGKVRQPGVRRAGRGRKPAATIPPNINPGQEKGPHEGDGFGPAQYPTSETFPNHQDNMENFQGRNYNQNQFGFGGDFNNQSGYPGSNYNKNPLNNLDDMSSNSFQNKRFFPQQNDQGTSSQYGNPSQNFDSTQQEGSFNPNSSNDSNLNASFDSNLNSSDSNYNQNDTSKSFDFNQDFSSEFYSNSNFQNPGANANYPTDNKTTGFQGNPPYFTGSGFRNNENFDYQSGSNMNFQSYDRSGSNFQNANSNPAFQNNSNSNFQNANRSDGFGGSNNNQRVPGGGMNQTPNFQSTTPGPAFQESNSPRMGGGGVVPTPNFQSATPGAGFPESNAQRVGGGGMGHTPGFQGQTTPGSAFAESNNQRVTGSGVAQAANFQNTTSGFPESNSQRVTGNGVGQAPSFQNAAPGPAFPESNNQRVAGSGQTPNFQSTTPGPSFQESNSNSGSNFATNFQGSDSNFDGSRSGSFMGQTASTNFQGNNPNFDSGNRGGNFQGQTSNSNFSSNSYQQGYWPQSNWGSCAYPETSKSSTTDFRNNSTTNDFMPQKFNSFEEGQEGGKVEGKPFASGNSSGAMYNKINCDFQNFGKNESETKFPQDFEESKGSKPKEEEEEKKEDVKSSELVIKKEDPSLPYDWATDLFKTYVTGVIENSSKMEVFFHIVTESIKLGDRLLVFSQSLLTLDLIEDYLHRRDVPDKEEVWAKNRNYFRLDGSTPGLEREKLINEFNGNTNIYIFLVSTRAGSLGINLVGANRVVVFDASWNPCHDTQAVCRVYRYGQRKPCYVYRLVMDSCLEKKIYDRQVNKQGMADRVVDELNPDAHLSIKEVTNLCWDDQEDTTVKDFSHLKDKFNDEIIKMLLDRCSKLLSKEPFQHESLLIDRKEKKLSQAEKRLAKRSYELEKQAANQPKNIYSFFPNSGQRNFAKPIASVRPMQSEMGSRMNPNLQNRSKWIPAEVWQKQGMSAQEMTLPLDVVIPTSSPEKTSIVLKAGQRVMVLKSPKGIYMQLENGKIIAIRSAFKVGQNQAGGASKHDDVKKDPSVSITPTMKTSPNVGVSMKVGQSTVRPGLVKQPFLKPFTKVPDKKIPVNVNMARSRQVMGKAKPFMLNRKFETVAPDVKQRLLSGKMSFTTGNQEDKFSSGEQSGTDDGSSVEEKTEVTPEESSFSDEKVVDSSDEKTEEKPPVETKPPPVEMSDSLETLRKVTERISDDTKRDEVEADAKYSQMNSLKNYRHNFTSQMNGKPPVIGEKKKEDEGDETEEVKEVEPEDATTSQQQGSENVQNWMMNQSYPPMDPYGNYFPGYYAYGPGHAPMMPPYDGFYPPSNYGHPIGRNSPMVPTSGKQQLPTENLKGSTQPPAQPPPNPMVQNIQNQSGPRYPPAVNTPPMYPPYPNPYPYPYNYPPGNPGFNNQGFPFPNQTQQTTGQQPSAQNTPTGSTSTPPTGQSQTTPYDNSMYSAFHRPEGPPFQTPENPYPPAPYPRPPYPNNGTPGFFPYNAPYPNYPYGHNFNPYMHPAGYGYPMQNPPPVNQAQNPNGESNPGTAATNASSSSSSTNNSSNANNS